MYQYKVMVSCGELHYDDEWEYNEGGEEAELLKTGGEEEVGRLKRNEGWHNGLAVSSRKMQIIINVISHSKTSSAFEICQAKTGKK